MITQATRILNEVFGYERFRPLQQEIIAHLLARKDTLVIMPTGGGKSLCYQIPALLFDGLTVVVSPLISLMKDQVEQLTALGVGATVLNSSLTPAEYQRNVGRIVRREVKLVYLAPETLLMPKTLALLEAQPIACMTIDEAHCISEWGHDFRPEYRQLVAARQRFPAAVCAAFTATATPRVREDIKTTLGFAASNEFVASFNRPNLFLQIAPKTKPLLQTVELLERFPQQSGIIYCLTRKQVDSLAETLGNEGFSVKPYHAGLSDEARNAHQEAFIRDDAQIMVATIAFGMGINKPNVRFVVHYDLPKNIEGYYQQIGRAGRDGLPAHCLLLFGYGDIQKIRFFIDQKEGQEQQIARQHLDAMVGFAESAGCRRTPLLRYFGEQHGEATCGMCDNCRSGKPEDVDLTIAAQKFLSCVKRTGEIFGAGHVIDVLRGSQAAKVLQHRHDQLSTYGIGKDYAKTQWFQMARLFLQQGLLTQDAEFGSLKLTPKAWDVFRGQARVFGALQAARVETADQPSDAPEYDQALFEQLRQVRKTLADRENVPPYIIFPDKTLMDMAAFFPQTEASLLKMHGVGAVKAAHYGAAFLAALREYCQAHRIAEKPKRVWKTEGLTEDGKKKRRHLIVGEAFNAGQSVEALMAEYDVQQQTILDHLAKYLQEGYALRAADLRPLSKLSAAQQAAVLAACARLGAERLKPLFEAFEGAIGYDEISLLRLHYLMNTEGTAHGRA